MGGFVSAVYLLITIIGLSQIVSITNVVDVKYFSHFTCGVSLNNTTQYPEVVMAMCKFIITTMHRRLGQ